ncbi:hypothetical protein Syun_024633 [Stephania yunnanensis]|uniref:Floricaula/leafy-like transcription factor n=1 Tax=Stephania yunnanensis TaxID=152371 RepID=A0AAP0NHM0_9MAGN
MDQSDAFSAAAAASLYKWDPRGAAQSRMLEAMTTPAAAAAGYTVVRQAGGGLEEFFQGYGIRYYTAAKIAELGFTVSTLLGMKDDELDDMMTSLSQIFRWDLLVGERYGVKAAVRAERRRLEEEDLRSRHLLAAAAAAAADTNNALDALSQEGLSEEPVQQYEKEAAGSGGGGGMCDGSKGRGAKTKKQSRQQRNKSRSRSAEDIEDDEDDDNGGGGAGCDRQREHPFIVTEPGEVARGKKNGLDYLFHLYEQCREFLIQVQNIARERGEKCPTKVTNQVFRHAKKAGASYINKPKMRHYVHCYALHCLDEESSNALRRAFKERGENVGAWRQACYKPLVAMAARQGWDIDGIFNAHPHLSFGTCPPSSASSVTPNVALRLLLPLLAPPLVAELSLPAIPIKSCARANNN